jgi:fructokinase
MRVLSFGEILFDFIEGEPMLGGAPLNFAMNLAKMGVHSSLLSRVGDDKLGRLALSEMISVGAKTQFVQIDTKNKTGTVEVHLINGLPKYTIHNNVAYDYINYDEVAEKLEKKPFDLLYFGTLAQRNEVSNQSLSKLKNANNFKHIFYDCNLRTGFYSADLIIKSLRYCSILKLNIEELTEITQMLYNESMPLEEACRIIATDFDLEIIIITAGDLGCYVYHANELIFEKGLLVKVADTVGAGDAFSAGFVFKYLQSQNLRAAARVGNRMGAYVASSKGAIPTYSEKLKKDIGI